VFVFALSKQFSINLQLLGGVWILQTFPAIVAGLYTRWFHRWALLIGWAAAMVYGTVQVYRVPTPGVPGSHWGGSSAPVLGHVTYIAIAAFVLNVVIAAAATVVFRLLHLPEGADETLPHQYTADPESVVREPATTAAAGDTGGAAGSLGAPPVS
jgi:solute:Na+ symporter, SSS family